jgi:CrcB protein
VRNLLLVGGGGFLGSVARYVVSGIVLHSTGAARFPYGTLVVNVGGCLIIGVIAGFAERAGLFTPETRLFLMTGFLGGFTTFSAFAYETVFLAREHAWVSAFINVLAQVVLGLLAVLAGHRLAILLAG